MAPTNGAFLLGKKRTPPTSEWSGGCLAAVVDVQPSVFSHLVACVIRVHPLVCINRPPFIPLCATINRRFERNVAGRARQPPHHAPPVSAAKRKKKRIVPCNGSAVAVVVAVKMAPPPPSAPGVLSASPPVLQTGFLVVSEAATQRIASRGTQTTSVFTHAPKKPNRKKNKNFFFSKVQIVRASPFFPPVSSRPHHLLLRVV